MKLAAIAFGVVSSFLTWALCRACKLEPDPVEWPSS